MRNAIIFLAFILTTSVSSVQAAPAKKLGAPPKILNYCSYKPAGFFSLAAMMNQVENCPVLAPCFQTEVEGKLISGYSLPWLWQGNANSSFTAAQQSGFKSAALSLAVAAKPSGKQLMRVSFFTDVIVPNGGVTPGFFGAYGIYAKCSSWPRNSNATN